MAERDDLKAREGSTWRPRKGGRQAEGEHGGANLPEDPRKGTRDQMQEGPPAQQQAWPGNEDELRPRADHGEESYRGSGRLEGRRALITGGDSGIGRAVAIAFAREGADVAIVHYDEHDDARETLGWVERAERSGTIIAADLSRHEECVRAVKEGVDTLGGLDILVNNAAYQCEVDDFTELTPEQVERTFRTNVMAYLWVAQAAVDYMPRGGCILNTGSVTALEGHASLIDYAATKGGIHTLTKSLAMALSERGIRVNCIAPGPVWTPLIPATLDEEHVDRFGADTMWGRAAQPGEIAPSYVFFASDDGRYYSGEILAPTGRGATR